MTKNKTYFIKCSELMTYEITVDANNEDDAMEKAMNELEKNSSEFCLGGDGFQIDKISEL